MKITLSLFWFVSFSILFSCTYRDIPRIVDCNISDLKILTNSKSDPTGCSTTDGMITVTAVGGSQPYSYSLSSTSFQVSNVFNNLGSGSYSILVKDANLCERSITVTLASINSTLDATIKATVDTGCLAHNGSLKVTASEGSTPYQYQLNKNGFGSASTFLNLSAGSYSVSVKDSKGCIKTISASVNVGESSVSYANDIAPLLTTYCTLPSCHSVGTGRDWTTYDNVKANATNIKARTGNRSMPQQGSPALTQNQIDVIACWVNSGSLNN